MIKAEFKKQGECFSGFSIEGHAGYAESGRDVVCSAVSSAVQLIVNILDEFDCEPVVDVGENLIECRISASHHTASAILKQLKLHLEAILEEFPKTIKITISEV